MCGRTACSRNRDGVQCACAYRPRGQVKEKATKPQWLDTGRYFYPSYNIAPQSNTPVLLSSQHTHVTRLLAASEGPVTGRVLQLMKWGLVPSWHRGDPGKFPTLLNNCRCEGMLEKPSFRTAIQKKQRCVVLADGFFEWNRRSKHKQPYFIHLADPKPSPAMLEVLTSETSEPEGQQLENIQGFSEVVKGRMLAMAGLFDIWNGAESEDPLYTYTIITLEAHPDFAHIHDRMPAILAEDVDIERWLDPSIETEELVSMLQPSSLLAWYPVSTAVNNVRHKTTECVEKIDPKKQVSKQQNTLLKWFSPAPKAKSESHGQSKDISNEEPSPPDRKIPKLE